MQLRIIPRALLVTVAVALGLGAASATAATSAPRSITAANGLESQVLSRLNEIRREHGLSPLRLAPSLGSAAELQSRAMGDYGFFAHESRDGSQFWQRIKRFYGSGGYGSWAVGENLLWASTDVDADRAVGMWMASPGHRRNILSSRWREIGLSAVNVAHAPGVFGGYDVTIITTDFAVRS